MEKLKAELRMLGQHDQGTAENKAAVIEAFFEIMLLYLTPAAIQTFTSLEVRNLLVCVLSDAETHDRDYAERNFMSHLGTLPYARFIAGDSFAGVNSSDNVVSIFRKS